MITRQQTPSCVTPTVVHLWWRAESLQVFDLAVWRWSRESCRIITARRSRLHRGRFSVIFTVKRSADTCTDLRRTRSSSPRDNQGKDGSTAFHKDDSRSHEMFSFPSWRWQIWRRLKKHGWDRPAENMYDSCVEIKTKRRPLNEWRMSACTVTKGKLRNSLSFWCRGT